MKPPSSMPVSSHSQPGIWRSGVILLACPRGFFLAMGACSVRICVLFGGELLRVFSVFCEG